MISSAMSKTSKLHEPIVRVQFVVFEIFTSAYLHQIARGIMALLGNNLMRNGFTVKSPESHLARNLSHISRNFNNVAGKKKSSRPKKQILKRSEFRTVNKQ